MKLRTWFYLLTAPSLALLLALLASTIWSTHTFGSQLQEVRRDGDAVVGIDRFVVAVDRELKEYATAIAFAGLEPSAVGSRASTHPEYLASARREVDATLTLLKANLAADPVRPGTGEDETADALRPEVLDANLRRLRRQGDSALRLARAGHLATAQQVFDGGDRAANDSIESPLEARMRVEERELEASIQLLSARGNVLGLLLLGSSAREQLGTAPVGLDRLEYGLQYSQAFSSLVTDYAEMLAGVSDANDKDQVALESQARAAITALSATYPDSEVPRDLRASNAEFEQMAAFGTTFRRMVLDGRAGAAATAFSTRVRQPVEEVALPRLDRITEEYRAAFSTCLVALWSRTSVFDAALLLLSVVVVAVGVGGPWMLARGIIVPVAELTAASKRIGAGDFSARVASRGLGELADLQTGFQAMAVRLDELTAGYQASEHAQRVAREAAESASRAKGDFLANMSHEIRTPMNGVMGMLDLALDSELPPEQRDYLEVARTSAESLLSVINDVLDFSKIESGKMELDNTPFLLSESLNDTLNALALRAHKKGLELALQVEPTVPDGVVGDAGRLRQIIINLVGNAIKFTDRGEVVVRVDLEPGDDHDLQLHFAVRDTGIGIPADKQQSIFEAFAQADSSTTRQFGGTGLGLSITARLVELMRGKLWVESEVGRGSTFHFTTVFTAAERGSIPQTCVRRDLKGLSVLVVDDNATNRTIMQGFLTRWDMHATVVESGPAALELLTRELAAGRRFQLLIIDAQMPGMDGFTLVEGIRGLEGYREPAIMMLSSATFHDDVKRCREVGIDLYLSKPVRGSELLDAIGRVVGHAEQHAATRSAGPRTVPRAVAVGGDRNRIARVLVAEDNPVNLKLTVALLERHGATVTVAVNGREAVTAAERSPFDVILMDLQMPEMDGMTATREIRKREAATHAATRVPIIALTARAMSGDRDRCLAGGMDGYVAKPLRASDLFAAIHEVIVTHEVEPSTDPAVAAPRDAGPVVFDLAGLREMAGGDDVLLHEVVALFARDTERLAAEIHLAASLGSGHRLREASHSLKGAAGAFTARRVEAVARAVEASTYEADSPATPALCEQLDVELAAVAATLRELGLTDPLDSPVPVAI